jgi:hypothetical protein
MGKGNERWGLEDGDWKVGTGGSVGEMGEKMKGNKREDAGGNEGGNERENAGGNGEKMVGEMREKIGVKMKYSKKILGGIKISSNFV